jgi:predicted nucleic acid-binding protein
MQKERNEDTDKNKPIIYLDTCILRNCMSNRNTEDIILLEEIRKKKYECITSTYTMLELFEIAKDRQFLINSVVSRWTEVNNFLRDRNRKNLSFNELERIHNSHVSLVSKYEFLELADIEGDDWELVYQICGSSNLHLSDCIHLATAYISNCTHLITRDSFFIEEGNLILLNSEISQDELQVCLPNKLLQNAS